MVDSFKKQYGKAGETTVASWLEQKGFAILDTNYRERCGEIDIIARHKELMVFVEVKKRANHYLPVADLVPHGKQQKIIKTAQRYIARNARGDMVYRFDVAYVDDSSRVYYIPNAFTKRTDCL